MNLESIMLSKIKSESARQIPCDTTSYIWNVKSKRQTKKTSQHIDTENRLMVARDGGYSRDGGVGEMCEDC